MAFNRPRTEVKAVRHIIILQAGRVRRSKLYYLRQLKGKAARIRRAEQPVAAAAEPVEKS